MTLDLGLSELAPTLEELLLIRQAQAEAEQNAAAGGLLAEEWREEAARLAELLAFLEATPAPPVPPKLSAWAIRLSVRVGQLSDFDAHFSAEALEADTPDVFPLLAASESSGNFASALSSASLYVQAVLMQQSGGEEHG